MYSSTKRVVITILVILTLEASWAANKETVAVLSFEPTIVSMQDASMLTDVFENRLARAKNFQLVERNRIESVMEELKFSLSAFVDESSSIALGNILAARWLVLGTVGVLGREYYFTIKLVNTETGNIVGGVNGEAKSIKDLRKRIEESADKLSKYILSSFKQSIDISPTIIISQQTFHSIGLSLGYVRPVYSSISLGGWVTGLMRMYDKKIGIQGGGRLLIGDPRAFTIALNIGTYSSVGVYLNRWHIEFIPLMFLGIPDSFGVGVGYSF